MVLIFQASVTGLNCQAEMLRLAVDELKCLLSKSRSRLHTMRRLSGKFNTNILTSNTHLQRVERTQALERIRSNLRDLVVAEVSVNRGKIG